MSLTNTSLVEAILEREAAETRVSTDFKGYGGLWLGRGCQRCGKEHRTVDIAVRCGYWR